jgi:flavin reductase (DIM6/NTAB) family NADH-FMN oxidoreductase RutF
MLYPVPAVLVSVRDKSGEDNLITVAWAGTVCSDPAMVSISVRKERHSHHMLMESKEFALNLTTKKIVFSRFKISDNWKLSIEQKNLKRNRSGICCGCMLFPR